MSTVDIVMPSPLEMIEQERIRVRTEENRSLEHDVLEGYHNLLLAAMAYRHNDPLKWPWEPSGFKPTNGIRDLVKSGALLSCAREVCAYKIEAGQMSETATSQAAVIMGQLSERIMETSEYISGTLLASIAAVSIHERNDDGEG